MMKEKDEVLTTKEACEYLKISRPTFLKLLRTNQIQARKVGRVWRLLKSELRGFFEMQRLEDKHKRREQAPKESEVIDAIDRNILRILSLYEHVTLLQLWYELGQGHLMEGSVTEEEIRRKLESLVARGSVERVTEAGVDGDSVSPIYRLKTGPYVAGSGGEQLRKVGS